MAESENLYCTDQTHVGQIKKPATIVCTCVICNGKLFCDEHGRQHRLKTAYHEGGSHLLKRILPATNIASAARPATKPVFRFASKPVENKTPKNMLGLSDEQRLHMRSMQSEFRVNEKVVAPRKVMIFDTAGTAAMQTESYVQKAPLGDAKPDAPEPQRQRDSVSPYARAYDVSQVGNLIAGKTATPLVARGEFIQPPSPYDKLCDHEDHEVNPVGADGQCFYCNMWLCTKHSHQRCNRAHPNGPHSLMIN